MMKKKICMLGAFAVGKTSLVRRFVKSIFSEKYKTTIGVKIDKKTVTYNGGEIDLVLWDLPGEDDFQSIQISYLRGTSGYLLVVDSTRKSTLDKAFEIKKNVEAIIDKVPFVMVINKSDLTDEYDFEPDTLESLEESGISLVKTSAKTGDGVEEAFSTLTGMMLSK
ncbi:MAG: GTP-binding protein [Candidatus Latescibacteria bacterium]|nr:GTP-binding protein [Candidatus Latescibacterota bacterium]